MINASFKPFVLHHLLYTPQITKNRILVSQFTKGNQVFFEFHPICRVIRNVITREVLLSDSEYGVLYKIYFSRIDDGTEIRNLSCNIMFFNVLIV